MPLSAYICKLFQSAE